MKPAPYKTGEDLIPVKSKPRRITENSVKEYLIKEVKLKGGISRSWYARGNAGVHDRIVLFPNDEIWLVEVKAPDGKKSPKQTSFHKQLYDMGYTRSITVWCKDDVDRWLRLRNTCNQQGINLAHWSLHPDGMELMIGRRGRQ